MDAFRGSPTALFLMRCLLAAFLAILFTQDGLDKVLDFKGNLAYLRDFFKTTPVMRSMVPLLLVVLMLLEVGAGLLSAAGFFSLILFDEPALALAGALLSSVTVVALFFGQRVAKDYAGAASSVPYFLVALGAVAALSP